MTHSTREHRRSESIVGMYFCFRFLHGQTLKIYGHTKVSMHHGNMHAVDTVACLVTAVKEFITKAMG
jgi:hypothetical protein